MIQFGLPDKCLVFGSREYSISGKYYDLTDHTSRRIIEFNGNMWHAHPNRFASDDIVPISRKTAQQVWDADAAKIKLAEDAGYQVRVVWESDYKKNPKKVVEECIKWLKQ